MIKIAAFSICILLLCGCTGNPSKPPAEPETHTSTTASATINMNEFWTEFCADPTDLQKTALLEKCRINKESYIIGEGEVFEVKKEKLEIHVFVKHCPDALYPQADIIMYTELEEEILKLQKGDKIKYRAQLKDCGSFGLLYMGVIARKGSPIQS